MMTIFNVSNTADAGEGGGVGATGGVSDKMLTLLTLCSSGLEKLTKSAFENIKRGINWSSSKLPSIQVLCQQIRGSGGS